MQTGGRRVVIVVLVVAGVVVVGVVVVAAAAAVDVGLNVSLSPKVLSLLLTLKLAGWWPDDCYQMMSEPYCPPGIRPSVISCVETCLTATFLINAPYQHQDQAGFAKLLTLKISIMILILHKHYTYPLNRLANHRLCLQPKGQVDY